MRLIKTRAKTIRPGDQVVVTVARTLGVRGRKPKVGAPLMQIEFSDGTSQVLREDERLSVIR